ncbi:MAG: ISAzo13 family transposase [Candidatus Thorarchaeota archaeon]|nr:MAG: ISAzo13 family transposase [Candidatus Thorarchaeota archaeon]
MELTESLKKVFTATAKVLKGSDRRIFMAQIVKALGKGGQRRAERELGWHRRTIRKGMHELESGFRCYDNFSARGRKPAEYHLPNLLNDIKAIAEAESQTDPTFKTTRLYIRISAAEVRKQLIKQKGYCDEDLPCEDTIRTKLNKLKYHPKKVKKSQPLKKIAETDAIFEQLKQVNNQADADERALRMSVDAKGRVLLALLSRGGFNRLEIKALDHDFRPDEKVTPVGVFLPQYNELFIFLITGSVTSDTLVDCIRDVWLKIAARFPLVQTLVINQDNGPECHSRRTQFMHRITRFSDEFQVIIQLAYYPPYHSKYNPIERVWGVLENYWRGSLLDSLETVFHFAKNMTYNGIHPVVEIVEKTYHTGVKLTKKAMDNLEKRFERLLGLEKWFVCVHPIPT